MNIIFVGYVACIRNIKEGLCVMSELGHSVTWMMYRMANPLLQILLPSISYYDGTRKGLQDKLRMYSNASLIHVHNEPSWLGWAVKEAFPDTPVIFDAHDLDAVRTGLATEDEIRSIHECDGVIFPSAGYRNHCLNEKESAFPSLKDKPNDVIYSMLPEWFIDSIEQMPRIPGIVYQGGVSIEINYRDYRNVSLSLKDLGVPFFVYGSSMRYLNEYHKAGAICMPTMPYMELLNNLSRFDWGFCGSPVESPQWAKTVPNKLFEYLAAGIPVIAYKADEVAEFVLEHGVGAVVEDLEEIPHIYGLHEEFRKNVLAKRKTFLMENEILKLGKIYKDVIH